VTSPLVAASPVPGAMAASVPIGPVPLAAASPAPAETPVVTPAAVAPPVSTAQSSAAQVTPIVQDHERSFNHFRLIGSALVVNNYLGNGTEGNFGGLVEVGYFFNREIGLNLYGAAKSEYPSLLAGLDLELLPIRMSVGRIEDFIQIGFILGASTTVPYGSENFASMHVGARALINLGERWGVTAGVRANLGYIMGDVGIAIHI
jgi:hypothetical protein